VTGTRTSPDPARETGRRPTAARIAPRALALVPWFDALLLAVSALLFANATARIPGQAVSLPALPFEDGVRPSSLAVAVVAAPRAHVAPDDPDALPAVAFLADERYDLSSRERVAEFRRDLAAAAAAALEKRVVVYLDGEVKHRDAMRLARALRGADVKEVLFAVRPPAEK